MSAVIFVIFGHISTHCMDMRSQTLGHGEECVGAMMELQELSRWILTSYSPKRMLSILVDCQE